MRVSKDLLLDVLPQFTGKLILIEGAQDVPDIINEVGQAHKHFAADYDTIYQFFDRGTTLQICRDLFQFCKGNIRYIIEGENQQTTKSPAAILSQGFGDCKHYAGFIAGVLSAISRNTGKKIYWKYRFASYSMFNTDPGHVYVVVNDHGDEISIDPVLSNFNDAPVASYIIDKKIKDMPLYRVSGIGGQVGLDPEVIIDAAFKVVSFVKAFAGDKVPNYPIKTQSTLQSIQAQIQQLLPLPPANVDQATALLQKAYELQAPLAGDNDSVRKTYFLIYGEIITALQAFIAQKGGAIDPATGLPVSTAGSFFEKNKTLLLLGGAGVAGWYFLRKKRKVSGKPSMKTLLLIAGGIYLVSQMNKKPAVAGYFTPGANSMDCVY